MRMGDMGDMGGFTAKGVLRATPCNVACRRGRGATTKARGYRGWWPWPSPVWATTQPAQRAREPWTRLRIS
jgi:hypothetical protein